MMREIKFRAFMEVANQDWLDEDSEDRYEMIYDFAYEEYETINDMLRKTDNLMQYTGLKDKNDKEIYEGDIVTFNDIGNEIRYIKFEDGGFYCISDGNKYHRKWEINPSEDLEVIGNIHENKELLL